MAEEGLVFYPLLCPYSWRQARPACPVAVIFAGTQWEAVFFSNPSPPSLHLSTGVSWTDGITERLIMFVLTSVILIAYIVR